MSARILIVDDEEPIRESLQGLFEDEGYVTDCAASGEEAVARFRNTPPDCVLLDIWLPGIDGLETLSRLKQLNAETPVVMMSGHATIDTAVRATRQGAFDFVEKPLSSERLLILTRNAVEKSRLRRENIELKQDIDQKTRYELIGKSKQIMGVKQLIQRLADTETPVLIIGEHGTGKSVTAKMIHRYSKRKNGPYVEVNTASIPESRMDSELFGHEKGAFPGALHMQRGRFEAASGGTLLFDEVFDLDQLMQAKILRVLQERALQRIGSPQLIPVDIRLIAASTQDLDAAMQQGRLREDFYYRLNVATIHMPPLRDLSDDIPLLMEAHADEQAKILGGEPVRFTEEAAAKMQAYSWPGNVRELRNYIERTHILQSGQEVDVEKMLPLDKASFAVAVDQSQSFHTAKELFERNFLIQHLNKHQWNISRTAEDIGMERSQLHRKIKSFGLSVLKEKPS
ncbi:MAG: sigma-54-dependent transcriptional regulator [Mariprofundaceae bacterium]